MTDVEKMEECLEAEEREAFTINDDGLAEWSLKKVLEEQAEYDRLKALADAQIEEIKEKLLAAEKRMNSRTGFLKGCLSDYMMRQQCKETKTQMTYQLLSGKLVFKKPSIKLVQDEEKLLEYLESNNLTDYIQTTKKVRWGEFKKSISTEDDYIIDTNTGEIIDCVKVEDVPGSFEVK